jgi:hypothetical protein
VGLAACLDALEKRKSLAPAENQTEIPQSSGM